jgi:hypothetical protein
LTLADAGRILTVRKPFIFSSAMRFSISRDWIPNHDYCWVNEHGDRRRALIAVERCSQNRHAQAVSALRKADVFPNGTETQIVFFSPCRISNVVDRASARMNKISGLSHIERAGRE